MAYFLLLSDPFSAAFKVAATRFLVSFGCGILWVDALNAYSFFGWKLGFWFSQQGSIYTFVVLIFVYVFQMNALDRRFNVDEDR